jgi:hypothetical protein
MAVKKKKATAAPAAPRATVRASFSLRSDQYMTLEALAKQKKVSTAWVLRDAVDKYIADQYPLFAQNKTTSGPA